MHWTLRLVKSFNYLELCACSSQSLYIVIFSICRKRSINWFFHVRKHSFTMFVFSTFICMSIFNRFVKSSRHFFVFEYNTISCLIEFFRAMIIMINTFIWSSEVSIVAMSLLRVRDFESEFITTKKLNEYLMFKALMSFEWCENASRNFFELIDMLRDLNRKAREMFIMLMKKKIDCATYMILWKFRWEFRWALCESSKYKYRRKIES